MESSETAQSFKFKKFIYGGIFNENGDILLCTDGKELGLPGGLVYLADICQFLNERWIPDFLSRKIEASVGIPASQMRERIQPLAATYNVYSNNFKEEHSAIIIGELSSEQVINLRASFFDIHQFFDFINEEEIQSIKKPQILILRIFASRDCPNSSHRKIAGDWLKSNI